MAHKKDKVKITHNGLLLDFSQTGETQAVTLIRLEDASAQVTLEGKSLSFKSENNEVLIDKFSSENLASGAYDMVRDKVSAYVFRKKLGRRFIAAILWGVLPLLGFLTIVNLSPAVTQYQNEPINVGQVQEKVYYPAVPQSQPKAQVLSPKELADALRQGAEKEAFTIKLSTGHSKGFYVFSDPTCPHCKSLEGQLSKLKDSYNITIFPVSAVGGDAAHTRVNNVLCAPADQRVEKWSNAIRSIPLDDVTCSAEFPDPALTNNQAFVKAELNYTPTIISTNGVMMPHNFEKTAASISQWIDSQ